MNLQEKMVETEKKQRKRSHIFHSQLRSSQEEKMKKTTMNQLSPLRSFFHWSFSLSLSLLCVLNLSCLPGKFWNLGVKPNGHQLTVTTPTSFYYFPYYMLTWVTSILRLGKKIHEFQRTGPIKGLSWAYKVKLRTGPIKGFSLTTHAITFIVLSKWINIVHVNKNLIYLNYIRFI